MMLLLSLRGNPIIYQGEELGLPQANVPFSNLKDPEAIANWPKTLGRDGARTPMPWVQAAPNAGFSSVDPWLPVDPAHTQLAVDQQQGNDSMLRFTAEALSVRKRVEALVQGRMRFSEGGDNSVLIIERRMGAELVFALFNFGDDEFNFPEGLVSAGDLLLSSRPLKEDPVKISGIPARTGVWIRVV